MSGGHPVGELRRGGVSLQVGVEVSQRKEAPDLQLAEPLHAAAATHICHLQGGEHPFTLHLAQSLGSIQHRAWRQREGRETDSPGTTVEQHSQPPGGRGRREYKQSRGEGKVRKILKNNHYITVSHSNPDAGDIPAELSICCLSGDLPAELSVWYVRSQQYLVLLAGLTVERISSLERAGMVPLSESSSRALIHRTG